MSAPMSDVQKETLLFLVTTYTLPMKFEKAAAAMESVSRGIYCHAS